MSTNADIKRLIANIQRADDVLFHAVSSSLPKTTYDLLTHAAIAHQVTMGQAIIHLLELAKEKE